MEISGSEERVTQRRKCYIVILQPIRVVFLRATERVNFKLLNIVTKTSWPKSNYLFNHYYDSKHLWATPRFSALSYFKSRPNAQTTKLI